MTASLKLLTVEEVSDISREIIARYLDPSREPGLHSNRRAAGTPRSTRLRKGPRTWSWAFSSGKRPQNALKRGLSGPPRDRPKALQIRVTQQEAGTTENRGVPGSSPGL